MCTEPMALIIGWGECNNLIGEIKIPFFMNRLGHTEDLNMVAHGIWI